jgi:hypothetical protein
MGTRDVVEEERVPVSTTRELLVIELRTHGKASVVQTSEETLERIFDRADQRRDEGRRIPLAPSGCSRTPAQARLRTHVDSKSELGRVERLRPRMFG